MAQYSTPDNYGNNFAKMFSSPPALSVRISNVSRLTQDTRPTRLRFDIDFWNEWDEEMQELHDEFIQRIVRTIEELEWEHANQDMQVDIQDDTEPMPPSPGTAENPIVLE